MHNVIKHRDRGSSVLLPLRVHGKVDEEVEDEVEEEESTSA